MMKFKLVNNKVTDEREEALTNKVAAECYYIMIAGTLVCLLYGSLFNNGVITSNYLTVLGCLLVTGLIILKIMIVNYQSYHNVYHNNPLDPRYLMAWVVTYMLYAPFVFFMNWAIAALGRYERRRLEKQLDDLENEE